MIHLQLQFLKNEIKVMRLVGQTDFPGPLNSFPCLRHSPVASTPAGPHRDGQRRRYLRRAASEGS